MAEDKINVELTTDDAELFMKFRKYQHLFDLLIQNDVFSIKNGKAVLNFDSKGNLRLISTDVIVYKLPSQ